MFTQRNTTSHCNSVKLYHQCSMNQVHCVRIKSLARLPRLTLIFWSLFSGEQADFWQLFIGPINDKRKRTSGWTQHQWMLVPFLILSSQYSRILWGIRFYLGSMITFLFESIPLHSKTILAEIPREFSQDGEKLASTNSAKEARYHKPTVFVHISLSSPVCGSRKYSFWLSTTAVSYS